MTVEFSNVLADKDYHHVPTLAQQKAKSATNEVEKLESKAKQAIAAEEPTELSVSLSQVLDITKDVRTTLNLVKDLLEAARRHKDK